MTAIVNICLLLGSAMLVCPEKSRTKSELYRTILPPVGQRLDGYASQYAPGVMEHTVRYRQEHGWLPPDVSTYDGFAAVLHCSQIGRGIYVEEVIVDGRVVARNEVLLVADCANIVAGPHLVEWMEKIPIEVGHATAARWGAVGRGGIYVQAYYLPWGYKWNSP